MEEPYFDVIKKVAEPYTAASVIASLCAERWGFDDKKTDELKGFFLEQYRFDVLKFASGSYFIPCPALGALNFDETMPLYPPRIPTPSLTINVEGCPFSYIPGQHALFPVDASFADKALAAWYLHASVPNEHAFVPLDGTSRNILRNIPSLGNSRKYLFKIWETINDMEAYHEHAKDLNYVNDYPFQVTLGITLEYLRDKEFANFNNPPEALVAALQQPDVGLLLTSPTTGNGKTHLLIAAAKARYVSSIQAQVEVMSPHIASTVDAFEAALRNQQPAIARLMAHYQKEKSFSSEDLQILKEAEKPYAALWLHIFGKEKIIRDEYSSEPKVVGSLEQTLTPLFQQAPVARIALVHFSDLQGMHEERREEVITTPHLYIDELLIADSQERLQLYGDLIYRRHRLGLPFTATSNYSFDQIFSLYDSGSRNRLISRAHDNICLEVRVDGEDYRRRRGNARLDALGLVEEGNERLGSVEKGNERLDLVKKRNERLRALGLVRK